MQEYSDKNQGRSMEVGKRHEIFSSIFGGDSGESDEEGDRPKSPVDDVEENREVADGDEEYGEEGGRKESPSPTGVKESLTAALDEEDEDKEERRDKFEDDALETQGDAPAPLNDPASLFGESDDEEELGRTQRDDVGEDQQMEDADAERDLGEGEEEDMDEYERQKKQRPIGPPLDLKIPLLSPIAPSNKMIVVTASNIVGFQMRPFDPKTYEEGEDLNVIRWRRFEREDGSTGLESNARFVRWSDGSVQLLLGNELLAADRQSMQQDKSHLFVRHPKLGVVQGQGRLLEKMKFRPVDLRSRIHKKLTLDLDSKYKKTTKVKNFVTMVDPEKEKEEREKAAEARIRSQEELARKQERVMKKYDRPTRATYEAPRRRAGYLEEEEENDEYDRRWSNRRYMDEEHEAEAERRILHAKRAEPVYRKAKPKEAAPVTKPIKKKKESEMDDFIVSEEEYEDEEAEEEEESEEEDRRKKKKGRQLEAETPLEDEDEDEELEDKGYEKQKKVRGKVEKKRKTGRDEEDEQEQEDVQEEEGSGREEDGWDSDNREKDRSREVEAKPAPQKKRRVVDSDSD